MKTISIKALRPVKMTAKTLMFEDPNHGTYLATRRVANDILSASVDEATIVETTRYNKDGEAHIILMLATPSCW